MMQLIHRILGALRRDDQMAPLQPARVMPVYEDMAAKYFESLAGLGLAARTLANKRAAQIHIKPVFTGRELPSIRPWEVAQLVKSVHDKGLHITSRHVLLEMRAMMNVAIIEGWVNYNPALQVKRLAAPVKRSRLTLADFWAIHDYSEKQLPPWVAPSIRLALVTGQRRSDIVRMRFSHVRDGHLYVEQFKTGMRVAIPLRLRLDALERTLGEVIEECMRYKPHDDDLLIRTAARPARQLHPQTVTHRFWTAQNAAAPYVGQGTPPTFHELRSLSARLYRQQGVDTQTLLGHSRADMTDIYEDDRGLTRDQWKYVPLPTGDTLSACQMPSPPRKITARS